MLEIACFDLTSAETALQSVADRIELCSHLEHGGLTPNLEEFRYLKGKYRMPIRVMIRPSAGSFFYSAQEFEQMKTDLILFGEAGADGFVFGVLEEKHIDLNKNRELLTLASGLPCVFHRAVDRTQDYHKALNQIAGLGFAGVLTSGHAGSAAAGIDNLKLAVAQFGTQMEVIIGGGIRSTNIAGIAQKTGGTAFHSSAIPPYEFFANPEEIKNIKAALKPT